jgi:hypothetical protein
METAPLRVGELSERGYFIRDYIGLAADGNDFVAALPITTGDPSNRTDIVAVGAEGPQP